MGNSKQEIKEKVIHGTYGEDEFLLVKEGDELLIVHDHYFHYSSDILFTVGHPNTDLPDNDLLNCAKIVVEFLNFENEKRLNKERDHDAT